MKPGEHERGALDELLARSYEPLRQPVPGQREGILNGLIAARISNRVTSRRGSPIRSILAALAACLVLAVTVRSLLVHSTVGAVYGFEAIPDRLLHVQTIRVRGTRFVYDSSQPGAAPTRVPFEYLVKRPDKFRMTWHGVSQANGPMVISRGSRLCDGRNGTTCNDTQKQYTTAPILPLDARIETELFTQGFLLSVLLGPPQAPFRKIGEEKTSGRWSHLYEGRFEGIDRTSIRKVWFDPTSGHPLRLVQDEVQPDGTTRRDEEIDEIAVNVPLADELFHFSPLEGYQPLAPPAHKTDQPLVLNSSPTRSASSADSKLELWHALQISEGAALLIWRRSAPAPLADGVLNWLSNVEFKLNGEPLERTLRHTWIHQSGSPDRWNWSSVVADGVLLQRDEIDLRLQGKVSLHSIRMLALRFPDDVLEQILTEAGRVMLRSNDPKPSLAELRARASQLSPFDASQ